MKSTHLLLTLVSVIATASLNAELIKYTVDPDHSGISFKIRHFLNKVPGTFTDFQGEIHFDPESPEKSRASAKIEANSVDTRNTDRDSHLQSEDFFKAGEFPMVEFTSTKWTPAGKNAYKVEGLLKMVGVEKPIVLDVTYLGEIEGRGVYRSGWEATATIDRTEWGIDYGTPTVGKEVDIEINVQARRPLGEQSE